MDDAVVYLAGSSWCPAPPELLAASEVAVELGEVTGRRGHGQTRRRSNWESSRASKAEVELGEVTCKKGHGQAR